MSKFIFTAIVEVEGEDEDDARIELILKMDDHDICWELENEDND